MDLWQLRVRDSVVYGIGAGLTQADYFKVLLSPHATQSAWMEREWEVLVNIEIDQGKVFGPSMDLLREIAGVKVFTVQQKHHCEQCQDFVGAFLRRVYDWRIFLIIAITLLETKGSTSLSTASSAKDRVFHVSETTVYEILLARGEWLGNYDNSDH